jgi:hypothetical protein
MHYHGITRPEQEHAPRSPEVVMHVPNPMSSSSPDRSPDDLRCLRLS